MAAADPSPSSRVPLRGTVVRLVLVAVLVVVVAEATLRADAGRLPEPMTWYHPSAQVKVEQMQAIADAGETRPVVVVGTSQMAMGVDPGALSSALPHHPPAYNAAVLAGYPVVTRRFVPEEVVPRLHPDVVVLGVSHLDLQQSAEPPYDDAPATSTSMWDRAEQWLSGHSDLVRFRSLLRDPNGWTTLLRGGEGEVEFYRRTVLGADGLWLYPRTGRCGERAEGAEDADAGDDRMAVNEADVDADAPTPPLDPRRIADVWSTVEGLEASGVEVVVASVPLPDCQFQTEASRERFEQVRRDLEAGAAERGALWVDLTDEMVADDLYHDRGHLNEKGSARYTALLAEALVEVGAVPAEG